MTMSIFHFGSYSSPTQLGVSQPLAKSSHNLPKEKKAWGRNSRRTVSPPGSHGDAIIIYISPWSGHGYMNLQTNWNIWGHMSGTPGIIHLLPLPLPCVGWGNVLLKGFTFVWFWKLQVCEDPATTPRCQQNPTISMQPKQLDRDCDYALFICEEHSECGPATYGTHFDSLYRRMFFILSLIVDST